VSERLEKAALALATATQLEVKVFVNGCQATVLKMTKRLILPCWVSAVAKDQDTGLQTLPDK